MEKSDKLDGSKGFEILYLCHPQTGQASKEEAQPDEGGKKIKAELYGALQLLLGGAAESYTQLMCSQCIPVLQLSAQPTLSAERKLYGSGNRDQELPASDLHLIFH